MKLEIELDLNKIDYDAINKQIAEKIAAIDIKDMYEIENKIDNSINTKIKDEVDLGYSDYISKYWSGDPGTTTKGLELINNLYKSEIEKRTKDVIDNIFSTEYNDDVLKETVLKIIPDVFAYVMFSTMEKTIHGSFHDYQQNTYNIMRGEIESRLNRIRY